MKFGLEARWLKLQIATQCAPLLAGIKVSNLLILPKNRAEEAKSLLKETEFSETLLLQQEDRVVYLVYRTEELVSYLAEKEVQKLLRELGYGKTAMADLLDSVRERYEAHQNGEGLFPHELGLALGYPPADVRGFMEQEGKNFLYSGYWKVYDNAAEAKRLFRAFEKAREQAVELVLAGYELTDVAAFCQGRKCLCPAV